MYYIQYAHARVASVMKQLAERGLGYDATLARRHLDRLSAEQETAPPAQDHEPLSRDRTAARQSTARRTHWCTTCATSPAIFIPTTTRTQFIVDDPELRNARLMLVRPCSRGTQRAGAARRVGAGLRCDAPCRVTTKVKRGAGVAGVYRAVRACSWVSRSAWG